MLCFVNKYEPNNPSWTIDIFDLLDRIFSNLASIFITFLEISPSLKSSSKTDKLKVKAGFGVHYQFVKKIVGEGVTSRSRDFWLLSEDNNVKVGTIG